MAAGRRCAATAAAVGATKAVAWGARSSMASMSLGDDQGSLVRARAAERRAGQAARGVRGL